MHAICLYNMSRNGFLKKSTFILILFSIPWRIVWSLKCPIPYKDAVINGITTLRVTLRLQGVFALKYWPFSHKWKDDLLPKKWLTTLILAIIHITNKNGFLNFTLKVFPLHKDDSSNLVCLHKKLRFSMDWTKGSNIKLDLVFCHTTNKIRFRTLTLTFDLFT